MKPVKYSPWLAASLVIGGMIVGYSAVIFSSDNAFAATQQCPLHKTCANGNCDQNPECANGKCSAGCPGNCGAKHS